MAKKKSKPVEKIRLSGRNIYTDKKGRVIFYDMITKKGYLVDKKHENSALFFKNRFVVLLFAAILFGATFLTWLQAAGCLGSDDGDCGICFSAGIFEKAGSGKRCGF